MLQIRQSIFETNSSSSNTLMLMTTGEYARWKNGEGYAVYGEIGISTIEEIKAEYEEEKEKYEDFGDFMFENGFKTYEEFRDEASDIHTLEKDGIIAIGFNHYC